MAGVKPPKRRRHGVVHLASTDGANERGRWTACRLWSPARAVRDFTGRMVRPLVFAEGGHGVSCARCARAQRLREVNFPPVPIEGTAEIELQRPW